MPALDQLPARFKRAIDRDLELGQQPAVGDHEPADHAQTAIGGRREERLLRGREVRPEHERGRRPVRRQTMHKPISDRSRVRRVREPRLLGKCAQP